MGKSELLENIIDTNDGYLFTSQAVAMGISRPTVIAYVKENGLEKAGHGVYVTADTWPDELYIIQLRNRKIIYSGETALYLHNLIDREYSDIVVSVPRGYNGSRLRQRGLVLHYESKDLYALGLSKCKTGYGHEVRVYDRERCICDLIKDRGNCELQNFQTAIKTYMRSKDKNLHRLVEYAEKIGIRDEVMKYVEVMI